ncbi:fasciclin domain-containing protein [Aequorivita sp. KMM 9714]|uniref:fasciclin domain-containing protein n=1 Tax=Aequorivita sp. KMM 9714 TaxID=2707173 RepID=UPI0013EA2288|nr:fasciclin domain-containing protein [Aequorivita sp. KMM 9714]NGX83717.1 fasciclin domain-containing protein [Aequorivita sp. KMM 9714]
MQKLLSLIFVFLFIFLAASCKNENQEVNSLESVNTTNEEIQKSELNRAPKKALTPEGIAISKSIMSQIMNERDLKRFASLIVTAEMATQLTKDGGAYTVFGPSNTALDSLADKNNKFYSKQENLDKLIDLLKSHIVEGEHSKESLSESISKSGKLKLKTLSGTSLILTKADDKIIISDNKGMKVKVLKGGEKGSNGTSYVVDGVLTAN